MLRIRKREASEHTVRSGSKIPIKLVFKAWPIYIVLAGYAVWQLRRLTHTAWLGSGWPQWVAGPDRGDEFDRELNSLHGISSLSLGRGIIFNTKNFNIDFCTF